ncbi:MAG: hypothetical protein WD767_07600 [Alphaproteobacteria bacterium]
MIDHSNFLISNRTADPLDWQVQCVCEKKCNNGWMRELDQKAAPVLELLFSGRCERLTTEEQSIVASWASMKAIVAEYENPEEISTHHMHRKRFFRRQLPPEKGWAVWIGYFPRETFEPKYFTAPFLYVRPEILAKRVSTRANYFNSAITTLVIGLLFIQVLWAPKRFGVHDIIYPVFPEGGMLQRIWPPNKYSLKWPPAHLSTLDANTATVSLRNIISGNAKNTFFRHGIDDNKN